MCLPSVEFKHDRTKLGGRLVRLRLVPTPADDSFVSTAPFSTFETIETDSPPSVPDSSDFGGGDFGGGGSSGEW